MRSLAWLASAVIVTVTGLSGRASADMLRYSFVMGETQVLATVDVAAPPANETRGWCSNVNETLLWRVYLQALATGPRWVNAFGGFPMISQFGTGIDVGEGPLLVDLDPGVAPIPTIAVSMSPEYHQDRLVIDSGRGFGIVYRGNFVSPTVLASIPEPSPLVLTGLLAAVGGAVAACRNRLGSA